MPASEPSKKRQWTTAGTKAVMSPMNIRRRPKASPPAALDEHGNVRDTMIEGTESVMRYWRIVYWYGIPGSLWEHFVSVDLFGIWRRHLVWAKKDGDELRNTVIARFASTTVFLSLLVSAEIGVFFSPSTIVERVREALTNNEKSSLEFWTGICLSVSIFFSISALLANFTSWSIFVVLSHENSATILRSSIGLYSAQMPSRLVISSIYMFFMWVVMFWWLIMPLGVALALTVAGILQISHIATTYSAMGRVIMATSAMSSERILEKADEEKLTPIQLYDVLLQKTYKAKANPVLINRQYRHAVIPSNSTSQVLLESTEEGNGQVHHHSGNLDYLEHMEHGYGDDMAS